MKAVGLGGGTTGEIIEAGNIRDDMFGLILEADIVICDMTTRNAPWSICSLASPVRRSRRGRCWRHWPHVEAVRQFAQHRERNSRHASRSELVCYAIGLRDAQQALGEDQGGKPEDRGNEVRRPARAGQLSMTSSGAARLPPGDCRTLAEVGVDEGKIMKAAGGAGLKRRSRHCLTRVVRQVMPRPRELSTSTDRRANPDGDELARAFRFFRR